MAEPTLWSCGVWFWNCILGLISFVFFLWQLTFVAFIGVPIGFGWLAIFKFPCWGGVIYGIFPVWGATPGGYGFICWFCCLEIKLGGLWLILFWLFVLILYNGGSTGDRLIRLLPLPIAILFWIEAICWGEV